MTLLLIAAAWILVLSLVTGLCAAARLGDVDRPEQSPLPRGWEPIGEAQIAAHPAARSTTGERGVRIAA